MEGGDTEIAVGSAETLGERLVADVGSTTRALTSVSNSRLSVFLGMETVIWGLLTDPRATDTGIEINRETKTDSQDR